MIIVAFFVFVLLNWSSAQSDVPRPKKKHNQEVKVKADVKPVSKADGILSNVNGNADILVNLNTFTINLPTDTPTGNVKETIEPSVCPICPSSNKVKSAIESIWNNDLSMAYACACNQLLTKTEDGFAQAILYQLSQAKHHRLDLITSSTKKVEPPSKDPSGIKSWEILGPINVGKLEMDADPTFSAASSVDGSIMDPALYLLAQPSSTTVHSDLIAEGKVQWQTVHAKKTGDVDVHFSVSWNELAQAMGSAAIYEFQGWARATTYAKVSGSYVISCQGVHTIYVRNDNQTRLLVGDVYRSNQVHASVDLKVGLVGIVLPLRGQGQSNFFCQILPPSGASLIVHPPKHVPDLLELVHSRQQGKGFLLSSLFSLPVQNILSYPITLKLSVEKPIGEEGDFLIREASLQQQSNWLITASKVLGGSVDIIQLAPGHTTVLSLELLSIDPKNKSRTLPEVYLNCQKNRGFSLTLTPSTGPVAKTTLEFSCRKQDQSFSISFLDHDGTVSQSALILPQAHFNAKQRSSDGLYPFLLSMHGSGISAGSNADAYKMMHKGKKDYSFGVDGYFVISPSRFGAHNWESVGELTAVTSVKAARQLLSSMEASLGLPQISTTSPGIMAGHSMGGHGAWLAAVNSPDLFNCVSPGSGWIKKEEYATANAFFYLDIHNSFVDDKLKGLSEKAMSEYHVDKLVSNLQGMQVHTRVGSVDYTTHPWYSRRMHRLLLQSGVEATLEEVLGKQHWWWDTEKDNDGGVVNDPKMREFYARCLTRSDQDKQLRQEYIQFLNNSVLSSGDGSVVQEWLTTSKAKPIEVNVDGGGASRLPAKPKAAKAKDAEDAVLAPVTRRCDRSVSLVLVNPAAHNGHCGVQVLQQHHSLTRSHVNVQCGSVSEQERVGSQTLVKTFRRCVVVATNVRRLELSLGFDSLLFGVDQLLVDGVLLNIRNQSFAIEAVDTLLAGGLSRNNKLELCWSSEPKAFTGFCSVESIPAHPLLQKSLFNSGPVRHVYSRPFFIVYGSPQNQALRSALRDLAVYLGNAHYSAHYTHVKVVSDLDYIAGGYAKREVYSNIVFIGGPAVNKLLKLMTANSLSTASVLLSSETLSSQCFIPGNVTITVDDKDSTSFVLASQSFSKLDQAAIFTLPIYRPPLSLVKGQEQRSASLAMGVVIHANSVQGYLHMSRVAWSVVPPMVRAPFANYIPDFMVMDSSIWSHGFGGVLAAGYWNAEWKVDEEQTYINEYALKIK